MTLEEIIWLAGFVDGEGYIGVVKKGTRYQCQLRIATTHRPTMEWVRDLLGASLNTYYKDHPVWRDSHSVCVYDKTAEEIIQQILPYLHTKREQAENLLKFRATLVPGRNQFSTPDPARKALQFSLYQKSKSLNQRGKQLPAVAA